MNNCRVCTSTKRTGQYYGAFVCSSCKIFFMRTVSGGSAYVCNQGGNCKLSLDAYTKCRACRFAMCLRANMQPELVGVKNSEHRRKMCDMGPSTPEDIKGTSEVPIVIATSSRIESVTKTNECVKESNKKLEGCSRRSSDQEVALVPYLPKKIGHTESLHCSYSIGLAFVKDIQESNYGVLAFTERLLALETYCGNEVNGESTDVFSFDLDVPMEIVLRDPLKTSKRTPMYYRGKKTVTFGQPEEAQMLYCRNILHYADWVSGCPELYTITERDKMQLLTSQYCTVQLLVSVYNTYKFRSSGFMFCNGYHYLKKDPPENEGEIFYNGMVDYVQSEMVHRMRELELRVQEYCLIKQIILFTPQGTLSEEGYTICRTARTKYEQLLVAYVTEAFPHLPSTEVLKRVLAIFELKNIIFQFGFHEMKFCATLVENNIAGLRGQLSYDIHLRKY